MMNINFMSFLKKNWLLLLILLLMLVLPMVVFCMVFKNKLCDVSAWASLTAGIFTYLGAAFLGMLTYYNTWSQNKQQEKLEELRLDIKLLADVADSYFVPFSEKELPKDLNYNSKCFEQQTSNDGIEMNYLEFDISNQSPFISTFVSVIGMYYVNDQNVVSSVYPFAVKATRDPQMFLDYKQELICYVGCSSEILKANYYESHPYNNWFVVLAVHTSKNKVKYIILDYVLGQTLGIRKTYLSEKRYQKRIEKNNSPICLSDYNAQFFKTKQ